MKKILSYLLIFLLAISGGYLGSYINLSTNNPSPTVTPNTVIQNSSKTTKEESNVKKAISVAYDSVVEITSKIKTSDFFYRESTSVSMGSGVLISEDGYIITNNHVIEGATEVSVKDSSGNIYEAKLIGTDAKTDIAVIKIEAQGLKYAEVADSDLVELGDDAIVIGNPLGSGIAVSNGIISATNKEITVNNEKMTVFQTNAAVNEGNSGGGLFNIKGELIGIVNAKSSSSSFSSTTIEGLGYAIPSNIVSKIANDLMMNGYVKNRATLGVKLYDFTTYNPYNLEPGLYITEVTKNSAADEAGLEKNDRIIEFDGQEITSYSDISSIMLKHNVGDEVKIKVVRNVNNKGRELEFKVTLQSAINEKEK